MQYEEDPAACCGVCCEKVVVRITDNRDTRYDYIRYERMVSRYEISSERSSDERC